MFIILPLSSEFLHLVLTSVVDKM